MENICVFCGSSPGADPLYIQAARRLGQELGRRKIGLVYGGGKLGMMGALARAALKNGAKVTGVIPKSFVEKEVAFRELSDLRVVATMHDRKALMVDLADGFIALPGGFGTFEELLEVLTWAQLGIHNKPCGVFNINGYFDELIRFLDHAVGEGFIEAEHRSILQVSNSLDSLFGKFESYTPPTLDKAAWAKRMSGVKGSA